jgi:hypothetical protein
LSFGVGYEINLTGIDAQQNFHVHSANGTFDLIKSIAIGYCRIFKVFWLRRRRVRTMKRLYFKYSKLSPYTLTILVFVFFGLNSGEAQAAVPGAATLVSPSGMITDITPAYTWNAESNSTWYYLLVYDVTGRKITQWYTAEQAGCAGGTGLCSIIPNIEITEGDGIWWIQTWNDSGYGPWSTAMDFVFAPPLPEDNGCLVIGDSIGEATHTNDACDEILGDHRELMDCMDLRLGSHDLDWSFMGGTKSWSIANRLECNSVSNRSHDGDEWKDALDRAWNQIQPKEVGNVILQLGSNDVCAEYGHDYGSLAFVQPTTPDNIVSIEAEHFIQRISGRTHQWEPDSIVGASIMAVRAQPDSGTSMPYPEYLTLSPRLDYRVNFVRTGIHYVWLRGYANETDDYLVHVGLDGQRQPSAENIKIEDYNEWMWSGITENGSYAMINVPSTGIHTLNVYMHQDGFRLDKFVLVTNNLWAPSDEGPFESARGIIKQTDQSGDVLVAIEAEHYYYLQRVETYSWGPDFISGYSAGGALRALPENGTDFDDTDSSPRLDYNVKFDFPGIYYIWVRGHATGLEDNSVHVGMDGINSGTADKIKFSSYNTWMWSNSRIDGSVATIEVMSAGIHTLNIWMHKDGFRIDKIILVKSATYQPSGKGPKEQWDNDLGRVAGHIDDTMIYLTENLPSNGEIYWSGIADISKFRDLMVNRKHDHAFKQCQSLWDLDLASDTLQGDAINSLCEGEFWGVCDYLPGWLEDELLDRYLNEFQKSFNSDTPCGRMLDSRNTQEDRDEARWFNKSLNDLMEQKAAQYHERKGVRINFTQALWYSSDEIRPYLLSRIDCYHPNRLGQMKLAHLVWKGHNPDFTPTDAFFNEGFDSHDWCNQEFTTWDSCWYDGGEGQCGDEFICNIDGSGWFKFGKETSKDKDHWIARDLGDLSTKDEVWAYFKHKRDHFDNDKSDWVAFDVWNGSYWVRLEKFSKNNDTGNHCSQYYNLTPYRNAVPLKIRFHTNNSDDMKNGDKLMIDDITIFAW